MINLKLDSALVEFHNVFNLAGGIVEWERDNLPLIIVYKARLSGLYICQIRYRG